MLSFYFDLLWRGLYAIPASLGSNMLGLIWPVIVVFCGEVIACFIYGWKAIISKWRQASLKGLAALGVCYLCLLVWCIAAKNYQDHDALKTKNQELASSLKRRNRGITSDDPAYMGLIQILRQFQGYGSAMHGKPCTIVFTSDPDSLRIAQAIAETSVLVSKCNTVAPIPPELPDSISNKEEGMVSGAIVVHSTRENHAAISFQRGLGNLLPTRYSYVPLKNPSFAMTDNVMWLQFGSAVGWRE